MVRFFLALLLGSSVLHAQPTPKLEFEVATIKPSPPTAPGAALFVGCRGGPGTNDPVLYDCGNLSLSNLVGMAYRVPYYQRSMPDWMGASLFDLRATVPQGTTREQLEVMVQNLLADRFKLVVHREPREMQRYELTIAKNGPKFKEGAPPAAPNPNDSPSAPGPFKLDKDGYPIIGPRGGSAFAYDKARLHQPEMTMATLASQLSSQLGAPVIDATGLTGKYEISLYWTTGNNLRAGAEPADSTAAGPDLKQALQEQLGLRVESKKGPIEFVVVDHAEKTPSEN